MISAKKILVIFVCLLCFQTVKAGWTKQKSGTLAWLRSVYFTNQNKGWIVGSNGTFLSTDDGGQIWKQNKKITKDNIRDVYFSDEKNGWLLCERNVYNLGSQPPSYLMKTSDGGANWEKINFTEGKERIVRFFFAGDGFRFCGWRKRYVFGNAER
ncbi:MAG: YCF48-related protein [Pyrinomonadaceae bacterium]